MVYQPASFERITDYDFYRRLGIIRPVVSVLPRTRDVACARSPERSKNKRAETALIPYHPDVLPFVPGRRHVTLGQTDHVQRRSVGICIQFASIMSAFRSS